MDGVAERVCVLSVGRALPGAARAIAAGFGIEPEEAVARIYRAPSVLVEEVESETAAELVTLLGQIGLDVESQAISSERPAPSRLYDVNMYVPDARRVSEAAAIVGEFIGATPVDVLKMMRVPPSVIVGGVSEATVAALQLRLGGVAELTKSRPEDAIYSVILATDDALASSRLLADLARLGIELHGTEGLVASGLCHSTIREVWQRHGPSGSLVVVNEAFLRFDILLDRIDSPADDVADVLARLAGIPRSLVDRVLEAAPITLNSAVPGHEAEVLLQDYAECGLITQATMISFQQEVLQITACEDQAALRTMVEQMGVAPPGRGPIPLPYVVPAVLCELDARMWKSALEDAGLTVDYVDIDQHEELT